MLMFIGDSASGVSGGDSGLFSGDGFFARAARTIGNVFEQGADFVASLPNEIIDFGRDLGGRIFGGASQASATVAAPFEREGAEFARREAGVRASGFLAENGLLIALGALIIFLATRR